MMQNDTPKIVGAFVISGIIFGGAYFVLASNANKNEPTSAVVVTTQTVAPEEQATQQPTTPATSEPQPTATQTPTSTYTNGTYSAEKTYKVPEGHTESVSVIVTVDGDVVTGLQIDTVATNDESADYQRPFDERIIGEVEGQDLDNADVSRLGGASLTSSAFNDLLDAIRNEAKA